MITTQNQSLKMLLFLNFTKKSLNTFWTNFTCTSYVTILVIIFSSPLNLKCKISLANRMIQSKILERTQQSKDVW